MKALGVKGQADLDAMTKNGIFWIEYEDCRKVFEKFCLNWYQNFYPLNEVQILIDSIIYLLVLCQLMIYNRNPALFAHRSSIHDFWPVNQGPEDDRVYLGANPQYSLNLDYGAEVGSNSRQVPFRALVLTQ